MKQKTILAMGSAIALLAATGAAYAGNNHATVEQSGNHNTASVDQSNGSGNYFGVPGLNSTYGKVQQTGNRNSIDVEQSGSGNDIAHWSGGHDNVKQDGDRNKLSITQSNYNGYAGNAVFSVNQNSETGSSATANTLTIDQSAASGNRSTNVVGRVTQINNVLATSGADRNAIGITQTGPGGYAAGNFIRSDTQSGSGNRQDIMQDGTHNFIDVLSQTGVGNRMSVHANDNANSVVSVKQDNTGSAAGGNSVNISLSGNYNGTGAGGFVHQNGAAQWSMPNSNYAQDGFNALSAAGAVGGVNPLVQGILHYFGINYPGVGQATATQTGGDNHAVYSANGSYNLFGFDQEGDSNRLNGLSSGDSNAVAVVQYHDGNIADFLQDGDSNDTGIFQQGDSNYARADATGDSNHLAIGQYGDHNDGRVIIGNHVASNGNIGVVIQAFGDENIGSVRLNGDGNIGAVVQGLGDNNEAHVTANGAGNILGAVQLGSHNGSTVTAHGSSNFALTLQGGTSNTASVTIHGNNNNQPILASFTGDAASAAGISGTTINDVAGFAVPLIGSTSLMQPGLMTQVGTGNQLTMDVTGNNNLFATLQSGDTNHISHTINGSNNQAAIVQLGSNNISVTTQMGNGNNVGITQ